MLLKYAVKICIIIIFSVTSNTSPVRAEDHMNQTKRLLFYNTDKDKFITVAVNPTEQTNVQIAH